MALAGGWRKGDRVTARVDLGVLNVGEGAVGSVVGPCENASLADKEKRVKVDFDNKGLVYVHVSNIQGVALVGGQRVLKGMLDQSKANDKTLQASEEKRMKQIREQLVAAAREENPDREAPEEGATGTMGSHAKPNEVLVEGMLMKLLAQSRNNSRV